MGKIPNLIEIYHMTRGHSQREAESLFAVLLNMQMVDITVEFGGLILFVGVFIEIISQLVKCCYAVFRILRCSVIS
jgi:hypothetical protein